METVLHDTFIAIRYPAEVIRMHNDTGNYLFQAGWDLVVEISKDTDTQVTQSVMTVLTGANGLENASHETPYFEELYKIASQTTNLEDYDGRWFWASGTREQIETLAQAWVNDVLKRFPQLNIKIKNNR